MPLELVGFSIAGTPNLAAEPNAAHMKVQASLDQTGAELVGEGLLEEVQALIYQPQGLPALDEAILLWLAEVLKALNR